VRSTQWLSSQRLVVTRLLLLPLVAAAMTAACGDTAQVICPEGFGPTIVVEVWDARAGTPAARETRGAAWSGAAVDSLMPAPGVSGDTVLLLLNNRPGIYDVEIQKVGFNAWDTSGVEVQSTGGQCATVITEQIVARLDSL